MHTKKTYMQKDITYREILHIERYYTQRDIYIKKYNNFK